MKKCIGIMSYLPNDTKSRQERLDGFKKEIDKLDETLNLPIIVIAQNYREEDKYIFSKNCKVYYFDKLGILNARKMVRRKLLDSKYDMFLIFDDDEVIESEGLATKFLETIDNNPDMYINYWCTYIRACAISRYVLERIPFPEVSPIQLEGWDDAVFIYCIQNNLPDHYMEFSDEDKKSFWCDIEKSNEIYPPSWRHHMDIFCCDILARNTLEWRVKLQNGPFFEIPKLWFRDKVEDTPISDKKPIVVCKDIKELLIKTGLHFDPNIPMIKEVNPHKNDVAIANNIKYVFNGVRWVKYDK